jgi:hypothetical protein
MMKLFGILHTMKKIFNTIFWEENLRYGDWYIRLEKELKDIFLPLQDDEERREYRHKVYDLVGKMLQTSQIPLAINGPNFDKERKLIDSIVIHHTKEKSDIELDTLSGIGFIRQYALDYLNNNVLGYTVYGKPIWSGHFYKNKQVFFAYHWLVRSDGFVERLLQDEYIGWHAGNWDINTSSVGIALSGNYEQIIPPNVQLHAVKNLISTYYPQIEKEKIIGHCEVYKNTICPGKKFLIHWKKQLLP